MGKRKLEEEEEKQKRQRLIKDEEWLDMDEEQLMCDAADEVEKQLHDEWGDSDDEQLMCDAVDEYERLNQVGHGQPEPAQPIPQQPEPVQPPPQQPEHAQPQPAQPEPAQPPQQQPEPAQPKPAQPPQAALNNSITSSTFNPTNNRDLFAAFRELENQVQEELRRRLNRKRGVRAYITVDANYTRESVDGTQRIIQHF